MPIVDSIDSAGVYAQLPAAEFEARATVLYAAAAALRAMISYSVLCVSDNSTEY